MEYVNKSGLVLPNAAVWSRLYNDPEYVNVAVDIEDNVMVSTIWDGGLRAEPKPGHAATIFETAVLLEGKVAQAWRTYTQEEALKFHAEVCEKVLKRAPRPEDGYLQRIIAIESRKENAQ